MKDNHTFLVVQWKNANHSQVLFKSEKIVIACRTWLKTLDICCIIGYDVNKFQRVRAHSTNVANIQHRARALIGPFEQLRQTYGGGWRITFAQPRKIERMSERKV